MNHLCHVAMDMKHTLMYWNHLLNPHMMERPPLQNIFVNVFASEFIVLKYEQAIQIQKVHVYETSCPGATYKISARNLHNDDEWIVLYSGTATATGGGARDFSPELTVKDVVSDTIRLDLHMPGQWTEIGRFLCKLLRIFSNDENSNYCHMMTL